MRPRTRVLAWGSCLLALALVVVAGAFLFATRDVSQPDGWGFRGYPGVIALPFAAVGALLASRRPENPIGWLFCGIAVLSGLQMLVEEYPIYVGGGGPVLAFAAWTGHWIWFPIGTLLALVVLLFPNGRLDSSRWRFVFWTTAATAALGVAVFLIASPAALGVGGRNPLEVQSLTWLTSPLLNVVMISFMLMFGLSAVSVAVRMRGSKGAERAQHKWFLLGAALVPFAGLVPSFPVPTAVQNLFVCFFMGIPIATGIAILRYRLYDIDVIINRTLVYGGLTAILALAYLGSVVVLQRLFAPITADSDLAVAGSTLAVAALFRPLKERVQTFIDRRFYRRKYDAAETLEAFSSRLRDQVDLQMLSSDLVTVVGDVMQPAHASVWLREGARS